MIDYNDTLAPQTATRDVQGTGGAPATLTIAGADPYDYGTVVTGGSSSNIFLTHHGDFGCWKHFS